MVLEELSDISKTMVVFNMDDCAGTHEENALNWIVDFMHKYPNFKVTLFTILGRWDLKILKKIKNAFDCIELAAHGWEHQTNDETLTWSKKDWYEVLNKYEKAGIFTKIWKSPNWETSPLGYYCLKDMGWAIAVRNFQIPDIPLGMKYYSFENNPFAVHCHTWTMVAHEKEGKFMSWGKGTTFQFVSENLEEKI